VHWVSSTQPPLLEELEELLLDDEPELELDEDDDEVEPPEEALLEEELELADDDEVPDAETNPVHDGIGQEFVDTGAVSDPRSTVAGHAWSVPNTA
jgi:hypothetical protein